MFRSLFVYWNNITDTPFLQSKFNMFFFVNIRIFKIKLNNYISFAITNINTLKYKQIKVFYSLISFELLYVKFITTSLFFLIVMFII